MKSIKLVTLLSFLFAVLINCHAADKEIEKEVFVKEGSGFSLGVMVTDLTEEDKEKTGLSGGAKIMEIIEESSAEEIGLMEDDIITEFDGKSVEDLDDLKDYFENIEEEKTVALTIQRDGEKKEFDAKLEKRKVSSFVKVWNDEDGDVSVFFDGNHSRFPQPAKIKKHKILIGDHSKGGFLGVVGENISKQMFEYFEVEYGTLIKKVVEESPAEEAGLKAGDVIYQVNDRKIEDFRDLTRTVNFYNPDEEVTIHYSRKGSKNSVKVKLAKREGHGYHFDVDFDGPNHAPDLMFLDEHDGKHINIKKKRIKGEHGKFEDLIEKDIKILIL